jgi:hypothetical protein
MLADGVADGFADGRAVRERALGMNSTIAIDCFSSVDGHHTDG